MYFAYLDQNVLDVVSKGVFRLPLDASLTWTYSDEHFNEVERSGSTRFLSVLRELNARKLALDLDDNFQITGEARLLEYADPHSLYSGWQKARSSVPVSEEPFTAILARLFGADNAGVLAGLPDIFEQEVTDLLSSAGILDEESQSAVQVGRGAVERIVDHLADRTSLETLRAPLGLHGGRAGNTAEEDNPLEALWAHISKTCSEIPSMVTADQFFGFAPPQDTADQRWPLYLGIVGCYVVLNLIGLRPDQGLSREERTRAIISDANHAGYAAYCHVLLSGDRRFCAKAKAIYRYKGIGTTVLRLERKPAVAGG